MTSAYLLRPLRSLEEATQARVRMLSGYVADEAMAREARQSVGGCPALSGGRFYHGAGSQPGWEASGHVSTEHPAHAEAEE